MKKKPTKKHPPTKKPKPRGVEVVKVLVHKDFAFILGRDKFLTVFEDEGCMVDNFTTAELHIPRKAR